MSMRVHELAKELKVTSKELLEKLHALKIEAKSHMAVLTDENVKAIKQPSSTKTSAVLEASKPAKSVTPSTASATSMIENAKRQMLEQKAVAKTQAALNQEAKRAQSVPHTPVTSIQIKPKISTPPPVEVKKTPAPVTPAAVTPVVPAPVAPSPVVAPVAMPSAPIAPAAPVVHAGPVAPAVNAAPPKVSAPSTPAPSTPAPSAPAHQVAKPATFVAPKASVAEPAKAKKIEIGNSILVKDLALKVHATASEVISKLIKLKVFASINQAVNFEIASKVAVEYGFEVEKTKIQTETDTTTKARIESSALAPKDKSKLLPRAPIVTFMGHVDHGKTSLLDAIRQTKVASGEAGGITQHIGAYSVFLPNGAVTFLDTPGHEAFTAMRARGARATDVVVLVVAADDGVMPQTIEAIDHAKAAGVPIVVAINKMDLPSANPDRVKKALMEHNLMTEDWGGKTIMVGVSAKTGKGIDELLEMLALETELLELKADPTASATGVVVEAELSKGSGVLATVLIQDGTLRVGDTVIVGNYYAKVRAMINDRGHRIKEASPSMPVAIMGLSNVPKAGDRFYTVKDEKKAREIIEAKEKELRENGQPSAYHVTLEHLLEDIKSGKVEELKLIIKSDVQGSIEALRSTLSKIPAKNARLNIIHTGVGDITESDIMLAAASNAVVIAFHAGMSTAAKEIADREQVDVRFYEIIYEAKTAIEKAMEGLLEPESKEVFVGVAEVRQVFKVSKTGTIAGCTVQKGKIVRNFQCRVLRNGAKVHEGKIESLKRFKDDAREVLEGFECGIGVSNFDEILAADRIEVFEIQKKARKLE